MTYTKEQAVQMARECFADPDGSLVILTPELHALVNLAAEKAVAEYKKDAERLDWIDRQAGYVNHAFSCKHVVDFEIELESPNKTANLRQAIDAAIAAEKG